jgi:hypothetical protein
MKKYKEITKLKENVEKAKTFTSEGRQIIANSCRDFYNLIEEDIFKADKEWMLKGMYNDLCNGNFAEPFLCERKKHDFRICLEIYEKRVVPFL